jgi:hypothetical protein
MQVAIWVTSLYDIIFFLYFNTPREPPSPPLPAWRARNLSKKKKENLFAALAKCRLKIPLVLILQNFLSW